MCALMCTRCALTCSAHAHAHAPTYELMSQDLKNSMSVTNSCCLSRTHVAGSQELHVCGAAEQRRGERRGLAPGVSLCVLKCLTTQSSVCAVCVPQCLTVVLSRPYSSLVTVPGKMPTAMSVVRGYSRSIPMNNTRPCVCLSRTVVCHELLKEYTNEQHSPLCLSVTNCCLSRTTQGVYQ